MVCCERCKWGKQNGRAVGMHGARVENATGMVMVQANCSVEDALALLEQRAADTGATLEDIAEAVISRRIRFGDQT
jgi:hypothetical protein